MALTESTGEIFFCSLWLDLFPEVALEREYRFAPPRRWRFDFAHPASRVAIEIEGGHWSGGRHTRGAGFEADCQKYNTAAALGWYVFRLTTGMIKDDNLHLIHSKICDATTHPA